MIAELLLVFVVTAVVIGGVALALIFGSAPVYRPTTETIQSLMTSLLDGEADAQQWQFFLDMPIRHDPELENLRLECAQMQAQYGRRPRNGKARLDEAGQIRLRHKLNRLEQRGGRTF
ncbi:hypothetical protein ABMA57_13895 [Saccharospirillum sp. HFRX-1]|uniref:hypothetical protein n=1 Tax=unclassified Saccharospirillum TaxID=2633430 RepID=UPI0037217DEA